MSDELKLCPFCKGAADISIGGWAGRKTPTCQDEKCPGYNVEDPSFETLAEAIAAWTRTVIALSRSSMPEFRAVRAILDSDMSC